MHSGCSCARSSKGRESSASSRHRTQAAPKHKAVLNAHYIALLYTVRAYFLLFLRFKRARSIIYCSR